MNRDEFERLKDAEKAHLRKVRALKQQLRDARRKQGLLDALRNLDTSGLDETHEEMLRQVTERNVTAEARFELAMDALDEAEKQEAARAEMARLEAERQKADAADLVRQMKAEMLGDAAEHAARNAPADQTAAAPGKSIGPSGPRPETNADPKDPSQDAPPPDAPPAKSIGRLRPDSERD